MEVAHPTTPRGVRDPVFVVSNHAKGVQGPVFVVSGRAGQVAEEVFCGLLRRYTSTLMPAVGSLGRP